MVEPGMVALPTGSPARVATRSNTETANDCAVACKVVVSLVRPRLCYSDCSFIYLLSDVSAPCVRSRSLSFFCWTCTMKRIASLSILFAALIEFAIEPAGFDLWIVAIVTLLWVSADPLCITVNSLKEFRPSLIAASHRQRPDKAARAPIAR